MCVGGGGGWGERGLSHLKVFFLSFFCVCMCVCGGGGGGGGSLPLSMTYWSSLHVAFVYVLFSVSAAVLTRPQRQGQIEVMHIGQVR